MTETQHSDVIIIGAGPAGYAAALYVARAGFRATLITGMQPGGQLTLTNDVENYPGFAGGTGTDLTSMMEGQALAAGAVLEYDTVLDIDMSARPFTLACKMGEWTADAVIMATGAAARWLGVPGESEYQGRGVSACAVCDGPFLAGKRVAVIGGGNTAVEEAIQLAGLCQQVTLIHRGTSLKAEHVLKERIEKLPNVDFLWNTNVKEFCGESGLKGGLTHLVVTTEGSESNLEVDGAFVAIGHDPASALVKGKIDLDSSGYIQVTPGRSTTDVPGFFAAGDVADPRYRQAVTAAGMGCMAALDAERYLRRIN